MRFIEIRPLDDVMKRWGRDLSKLGSRSAVHRVIARAANYEGRKAYTRVKRVLRKQTSIPAKVVNANTRFIPATTAGGAIQVMITGSGKGISLKEFGARQNARGVTARVWGKAKQFPGGFMGPRPGAIAAKLKGHAFHRTSKKRHPIKKMFGPGIAKELIKDQTKAEFYAAQPMIIARVGKEIAAVLRGY